MLKRVKINKGSGEEFIEHFNNEEYDEGILLLDSDFEFDYVDRETGFTPLITAINHSPEGEYLDVAMRILHSGYSNPYTIAEDGSSALSMACQFGHIEILEYLSRYPKLNCHHTDDDDNTPLMNCLLYKSVECAKFLLYSRRYLHIEFATLRGRSALQMALKKDMKEIALMIYERLPIKHHVKMLKTYDQLIDMYQTSWKRDLKVSFTYNLRSSYFFLQLNEKIFDKISDFLHYS